MKYIVGRVGHVRTAAAVRVYTHKHARHTRIHLYKYYTYVCARARERRRRRRRRIKRGATCSHIIIIRNPNNIYVSTRTESPRRCGRVNFNITLICKLVTVTNEQRPRRASKSPVRGRLRHAPPPHRPTDRPPRGPIPRFDYY